MATIIPIVQYIEQFTVTGFSATTSNSNETSPTTAKIPGLWQQLYSSDLAKTPTSFVGVYSNYESDANGLYTITAGVVQQNDQASDNTIIIQPGNYLVFSNKGAMPGAVIEAWKQVWNYFSQKSHYERSYITDFELYNGAEEVAVYIGID